MAEPYERRGPVPEKKGCAASPVKKRRGPVQAAKRRSPRRDGVETFFVQAEIPDGVLHDGWNDVELFNHGNDHTIEAHELVWMEIALTM